MRLSEVEGASFLERPSIGLLPFTPLMRPPIGLTAAEWVEACVSKTYDAPVDSVTRATLLYALSLLGSLAHDPELFQQLIPEEIMQESPFYEIVLERGIERGIEQGIERGIEQGIARGAREMGVKNILAVLRTRFPESDTRTVAVALERIREINRLDQLLNTALLADTFNDFSQALDL